MYNDEYHIVINNNYLSLEIKINQMMKEGWVPLGGLAVVPGGLFNANFFQAMTRSPLRKSAFMGKSEE